MALLIQKCVSYVSFLKNKQVWLINILVQNGEKINRGMGFLGCMLRFLPLSDNYKKPSRWPAYVLPSSAYTFYADRLYILLRKNTIKAGLINNLIPFIHETKQKARRSISLFACFLEI